MREALILKTSGASMTGSWTGIRQLHFLRQNLNSKSSMLLCFLYAAKAVIRNCGQVTRATKLTPPIFVRG